MACRIFDHGNQGGPVNLENENHDRSTMNRRQLLGSGLALGSVAAFASACSGLFGGGSSSGGSSGSSSTITGIPGSLPDPSKAPGTNLIPQIDHIVIVMLENHSYDNILGMLPRGNGFTLDSSGNPTNTNPNGSGDVIRAFHTPTPCRAFSTPSQSWNDSHVSYDNGTNQGFVTASGGAAMAYYDSTDVPFTYSLASTFPICDNYFSSVLGQTFPNRRYMLAATSYGMVNDTPGTNSFQQFLSSGSADVSAHPPNGTIIDLLNQYNISWKNYNFGISSLLLYPYLIANTTNLSRMVAFSEFLSDAKNGTLPSFSLIDPNLINFVGNSEGEGDDIQYGDGFLGQVVNAVMSGPNWSSTMLVYCYDEAGGYYDHVVPPTATVPDDVPPQIVSPPDQPGGFDRYGFRVPCGVVSPYAKKNYVSHVVSGHTSLCRLVESKWNLPAMTQRDAVASNLLDMIDLNSAPAFATPPSLAAAANPSVTQVASCELNSSQNPPASDIIPVS